MFGDTPYATTADIARVEGKLDELIRSEAAKYDRLDAKVGDMAAHGALCDLQHEQHKEGARRVNDKLDVISAKQSTQDSKLDQILENQVLYREGYDLVQQHKDSLKRNTDDYIAKDTLKRWATWSLAVGGCIGMLWGFLHFVSKLG